MDTRNPFPGMNPWLERYWEDVHHRIVQYASDQIQPDLPGDLYAAVERTVYSVADEVLITRYRPDVAVLDTGEYYEPVEAEESAVAVAKPLRVRLPDDEVRVGHIEIRDTKDAERVVTAIEVISPANKFDSRGRVEYEKKRSEYHRAMVSVVEIDLLRRGAKIVDVPLSRVPRRAQTPYCCCVRVSDPPAQHVDYYPLPLRKRLSRIEIPLRPSDKPVVLDLQELVDQAYVKGRYGGRLKYDQSPEPPLSAEDEAWAREVVRAGRESSGAR